jgi:hypothetical protein
MNSCYTVIFLLRVSAPEYCSIQLFVILQTPAHNTAMLNLMFMDPCILI